MNEAFEITHDNLPLAMSMLFGKISRLEQLLEQPTGLAPETDCWYDIDGLCGYLPGNPAKATIYSKVHNRGIPHKKVGKRLMFLKSEIDIWLKGHTRKTTAQIESDAVAFIESTKGAKSKKG